MRKMLKKVLQKRKKMLKKSYISNFSLDCIHQKQGKIQYTMLMKMSFVK